MDWLDLLAVHKSLLQHHSSKASGLYYPGSTFTFRELLMVTNPSSSFLPLLIQEGLLRGELPLLKLFPAESGPPPNPGGGAGLLPAAFKCG